MIVNMNRSSFRIVKVFVCQLDSLLTIIQEIFYKLMRHSSVNGLRQQLKIS